MRRDISRATLHRAESSKYSISYNFEHKDRFSGLSCTKSRVRVGPKYRMRNSWYFFSML